MVLFLFLILNFSSFAQVTFQPEAILGHIVPNFQDYPSSGLLYGGGVSIRIVQPKGRWKRYYPRTETGVFVGCWNMGNDSIFGSEITTYPFIEFPLKKKVTAWSIRVGLGAAYFTKHHSPIENSRNAAVGSSFTWAFEGSLNWKKSIKPGLDLTLSGKYLHGSNGHLQLPNYGINSGALGIGLKYYVKGRNEVKVNTTTSKHYFLQLRTGLGLHEYGDAGGPVGEGKYGVQFVAAYVNILYNQKNKLKLGFTFRHYNSYQQYIRRNNLTISANSFSFILGHEFVMGHVGIDIDGLLHIYKPFYRTYFDKFGTDSKVLFFLNRYLGARVAFNLYLFAPSDIPKHNLFFGTHLNTNNGEADFSSIGVGYEWHF